MGCSRQTQSLLGWRHSNQDHGNWRALANFSRYRIPKPLSFLGLQTASQFNLHFPLVTSLVPAQRKACSIEARHSSGILSGVRWNIAWDVMTDLAREPLLAALILFMSSNKLPGYFILKGLEIDPFLYQTKRGSPKYFMGKEARITVIHGAPCQGQYDCI
jgi:hypothetical protein